MRRQRRLTATAAMASWTGSTRTICRCCDRSTPMAGASTCSIAGFCERSEGAPAPPRWAGLKFFNAYGPNEYHKGGQRSVALQMHAQIRESGRVHLFRSENPRLSRRRPIARFRLGRRLRSRGALGAGEPRSGLRSLQCRLAWRDEFTCGPACLMMIFKYFDRSFVLNKKNEIDLWRESSLAPLPPTSRYGLTFAALKRGFGVEVLTNTLGNRVCEQNSYESHRKAWWRVDQEILGPDAGTVRGEERRGLLNSAEGEEGEKDNCERLSKKC